jgi:hypothetical protein
MDSRQFQINSAIFQKRPAKKQTGSVNGPARLAEAIRQIMQQQIEPMVQKNGGISRIWNQILPDELKEHCRLEQITNGQLKVKVDSSAYLYSARLISRQLVEQINRDLPRAQIKSVKFVPG